MLDKIVLSKDRKSAVVHYTTHSVTIYHSYGRVTDLLWNLFPEFTCLWMLEMEDTQEIDISRINDAA
jgi:hypothetical protein